MAKKFEIDAYLIETKTDANGCFSVPHGLEIPDPTNLQIIQGIVVSVQHKNGNWHTLEYSHNVDNRFWWSEKRGGVIAGVIASPDFHERPVKIVALTRFLLG